LLLFTFITTGNIIAIDININDDAIINKTIKIILFK